MKIKAQLDLTEGPILAMLAKLAIPILGTSFLQMLYNLTNIFWLGRLSAASMAGAGIGGFILWLLSSFGGLTRSASIILGSNAKGSGDEAAGNRVACQTLFWTLVLGLAACLVLLPTAHLIAGLFHLKDAQANGEAIAFIRVCAMGSPFLLLFPVLSSLCIGWGDSRTPFRVSLLTVLLNLALDPLFIFGLGWQAAGAAWATVLSNALGSLLLLRKFAPAFKNFFRPRLYLGQSLEFLKLGLPQCAEGMVYAGFSMMVGTLLGNFGPAVLAANSLGAQVESLTWMLAVGLSSAATSFCGQNWGGARHDRIRQGYHSLLLLTFAYASSIGLIFFLMPEPLARLFSSQPEVIAKGREYFTILALSQPFMAVELAIGGCFRGIQAPGAPSLVSIVLTMARFPLSLMLFRAGYGYQAIWWVISGSSILKGLIITLGFPFCHRRKMQNFGCKLQPEN